MEDMTEHHIHSGLCTLQISNMRLHVCTGGTALTGGDSVYAQTCVCCVSFRASRFAEARTTGVRASRMNTAAAVHHTSVLIAAWRARRAFALRLQSADNIQRAPVRTAAQRWCGSQAHVPTRPSLYRRVGSYAQQRQQRVGLATKARFRRGWWMSGGWTIGGTSGDVAYPAAVCGSAAGARAVAARGAAACFWWWYYGFFQEEGNAADHDGWVQRRAMIARQTAGRSSYLLVSRTQGFAERLTELWSAVFSGQQAVWESAAQWQAGRLHGEHHRRCIWVRQCEQPR